MNILEGIAHQIAREARIAANCALDGWAYSIAVSGDLFLGEMEKTQAVRSYPTRSAIARELVRIDLDFPNVEPHAATLKFLLRMELEPFIIGVGQVRIFEPEEGLISLRRDERQVMGLGHFGAPVAVAPTILSPTPVHSR